MVRAPRTAIFFLLMKRAVRGAEMMKDGLAALMLMLLLSTAAAVASIDSLPGCPSTCGNVRISYPFGIGPNCSRTNFMVSCKNTGNGVYKPFLTNTELINISLQSGQARIYNSISWQCYNATSGKVSQNIWLLNLANEPYQFSDTDNEFIVVGCDTLAYINGQNRLNNYDGGCVSVCHSKQSLTNGSCSGIGWCKTSIPKGIYLYHVSFNANYNNSRVHKFNPCSYAVLAEVGWFNFSIVDVIVGKLNETNDGPAPVVLNWAISNDTCKVAQRNRTSYACLSEHSYCVDSGPGYLCNCSTGYQGNLYPLGGCKGLPLSLPLPFGLCF